MSSKRNIYFNKKNHIQTFFVMIVILNKVQNRGIKFVSNSPLMITTLVKKY